MKIKVCGIRNQNNLTFLNNSKVDFIGFIFYEKSSRNFKNGDLQGPIESSKRKVGVFVDEDISTVESLVERYELDYLQLHGNESVAYCKTLKSKGYRLMKAFSVNDQLPENLKDYEPLIDFFLFDTKGQSYGGNGIQFDWKVLEGYGLNKPFFLSGGIGPDDIEAIKKLAYPQLYAVDVNSRFEVTPGEKNEELLKEFIEELKK